MEPGTEKATTPAGSADVRSARGDREAVRLQPRRTVLGRNATKADVFVYPAGSHEVAVKDYGPRPWWIRHTLGRWLIAREARAYRAAGRVPGLVEFLGRTGPFSLSTRYVDAQPLFSELPVDMACFDRLEAIVADLHERGVSLGDLHRRDVLLDHRGGVHVLDLATAWVAGPNAGRVRRWLFDRGADADRVSLVRLRARASGQDPAAAVDALGGEAARWDRRFRRLRRVRDRLQGKTHHATPPSSGTVE